MEDATELQLKFEAELEEKYSSEKIKQLQTEILEKFSQLTKINDLLTQIEAFNITIEDFESKVNKLVENQPKLNEIVKSKLEWASIKENATTLHKQSPNISKQIQKFREEWKKSFDTLAISLPTLQNDVNNLQNKINAHKNKLAEQRNAIKHLSPWEQKAEGGIITVLEECLAGVQKHLDSNKNVLNNYPIVQKTMIETLMGYAKKLNPAAQKIKDFAQDLVNVYKAYPASLDPQKTATQFGSTSPAFHKQPSATKLPETEKGKEDTDKETPHP